MERIDVEDACEHKMFVQIRWQGRKVAIPLSQLRALDPDESTIIQAAGPPRGRPRAPQSFIAGNAREAGLSTEAASLRAKNLFGSPDGSRVAYASKGRLYTRRLDQPDAKELPGTDVFYPPFFSPDGRWIAFEAQDKLKKITVEGGEAIPLCDALFPAGEIYRARDKPGPVGACRLVSASPAG